MFLVNKIKSQNQAKLTLSIENAACIQLDAVKGNIQQHITWVRDGNVSGIKSRALILFMADVRTHARVQLIIIHYRKQVSWARQRCSEIACEL